MPERRFLLLVSFVKRINVSARDDQNVNGRLRAQVIEGQAHVVLKDPLRRYLAGRYLAENTVVFTHAFYNCI